MNTIMPPDSPSGEPGSARTESSNLALACTAEAIGTFLLVLVGTAVATAAVQGKGTAGPAYNSLAVALSFGLILIPIVGSLGQISGAHVNPSVTLGLAVAGKFPWRFVAPYWGSQLAGAIVAALVVWAAYGHGAYVDAHLGAPSPANGANAFQVLLVEALIAFILVFTVISTATDPRVPAGTAAVAIGFSLSAGVLLGGPISGGAGNPARALGPMIVSGTFPVWFFYTVGPLLGAIAAAGAFRMVGMANTPKVPPVADIPTNEPLTTPHADNVRSLRKP
ncbi:MAG: MIP/aquaporin family protein [Janthinobacterium lividum]